MKVDSNPDDVAVERADLISRLRREINHAAGGTSGLDRQDELLKTWHEHEDSGDRDFSNDSNDLNGEAPSPSGDFHDTVKPGQTGDSNLDLERLPTGWISMCKDRIGSDVSSVGIDSQMGGGLLRHGIHEWIGDPYQAPQVDLSSKSPHVCLHQVLGNQCGRHFPIRIVCRIIKSVSTYALVNISGDHSGSF